MPSNDRVRANDGAGGGSAWEQPINQNENQPIEAAQSYALGCLPSNNARLMAENENFGLEPSSRPKPRCDEADQQANKVKHRLVG